MPEVIVIDEIGTELEALAARTIAERGVQLIGTAHGNNLDNLMLNPTLSDLIGGIQTVTLGDDEARRRRTQKSVLERKAPPTFDVVVEIPDRDRVRRPRRCGRDHRRHAAWRCPGAGDALARRGRRAPIAGAPAAGPAYRIPGERFGGLVGRAWAASAPSPAVRTAVARRDRRARGCQPARASRGRRAPRLAGDESRHRAAGPAVFRAGAIADRGPLERGTSAPEPRARDARELERQAEWRASANRALDRAPGRPGRGRGAERRARDAGAARPRRPRAALP